MSTASLPLRRQSPLTGRIVLPILAALLLATGFSGHAGVQVLDGAMLAKLYQVHRHGVPGEAAYIASHGTWEGYVHPHCHGQPTDDAHQPGPDQVQAAASLAGAVACTEAIAPALAPPTPWRVRPEAAGLAALDPLLPPRTPPPR